MKATIPQTLTRFTKVNSFPLSSVFEKSFFEEDSRMGDGK